MDSKNLLKDPNTNWKYVLVVLFSALLVGGGILGYQYLWLPKQEVEMPEIEIPKGITPEAVAPEKIVEAWDVFQECLHIVQESIETKNIEDLSRLEDVAYDMWAQDYEVFMRGCPEEFDMSKAECEEMFWDTMEFVKEVAVTLEESDFKNIEEDEKQIIMSTDLEPDQEGGYSRTSLYFVKDRGGKIFFLTISKISFHYDGGEEAKDSDKDGLTDKDESETVLSKEMCERAGFQKWDMECVTTDPNLKDTDGDDWWDGVEVQAETDPNSATEHPFL